MVGVHKSLTTRVCMSDCFIHFWIYKDSQRLNDIAYRNSLNFGKNQDSDFR